MNRKIVFFDIDGTLAEGGAPASHQVCDAIHKLRKNGHYAIINTGRSKSYIYDEILKIGFDGIISAAGSHIEFENNLIFDAKIPPSLLSETVHKMSECNITVILEGTYDIFALPSQTNPHIRTDIPIIDSINEFDHNYCKKPINKYTYYLKSRKQIEPLLPFLQNFYHLIIHDPDYCGEIVLKGISKASAMKKLLNYLSINQKDSYAIGDSLNDLEMIRSAGCGIAMGNSIKEIQQSADLVTSSISDDGVAKALKMVGLI